MPTELVYLHRDNTIDLQLVADGASVNLAGVTRMQLLDVGGGFAVDAVTSPSAFDWAVGDGVIHLALGDEAIPAGTYDCWLVVHDVATPDGIVWGKIKIVVIAI